MQNSEFWWLSKDDVVEFNLAVIEASPHSQERHQLLDEGKLESALNRAIFLYQYENPDIADLAAVFLVGIASAHAFEQGNKRTAFLAARFFLLANGYDFTEDSETIAEWIVEALEKKLTLRQLAERLRSCVESLN